jgi:hypothetical protein
MMKNILLSLISIFLILSCSRSPQFTGDGLKDFSLSSKPSARYWWFASMIKKEDVRYNLDWLKRNGFGGVEVAWVYPLNRFNPKDTSYTTRQEWLSEEWKDIVRYTISYADSIGLSCDLTFGTLWPFGDSYVTFDQASQRFGDTAWRQRIIYSWQHPKTGYVVDHLTPAHYQPYFERLIGAFPRPGTKIPQCYFIDSWEVETEKLWCDGFDKDFIRSFGYDIVPIMDSIYTPDFSAQLYDYMSLISRKVLRFYSDFDSTLNASGILSRGQVSGAPCDLISGYAIMDVPEGESMLFEPEFCAIPASAALLSGKKYVSSESFTCIYGWPRDYIREEQTADLKLVADALFANGINHIIWHGKPHNPAGHDTVNFYATTHVGATGNLAGEIPEFNNYLGKVSGYMTKGSTYSDIAVYLPAEDAWTAGRMPVEKQFIWAWGYYEMRYVYFPGELQGYCPAWINGEFLKKASAENGSMVIGDANFKALYIDAQFLAYDVLEQVARLADKGLKIILKRDPLEPGTTRHENYPDLVRQLKTHSNVSTVMPSQIIPFITGRSIPRHWCRKDGETMYVFFPDPSSDHLKFPIEYGQSLTTEERQMEITLDCMGKTIEMNLVFKPYQSLLYKIENGVAESVDIEFIPKTPSVKHRPEGYKAPWLVDMAK